MHVVWLCLWRKCGREEWGQQKDSIPLSSIFKDMVRFPLVTRRERERVKEGRTMIQKRSVGSRSKCR